MANSSPNSLLTRIEGGWSLAITRNWTDYVGKYHPEDETGFLSQLLTAKPQIFETAIAHGDYKLTPVGETYALVVELKSVFETITIILKSVGQPEGLEVKQLKSRVMELESKVEDLESEMEALKEVGETVGERYVPTPTVKDEELMRYAMAFHDPFITFVKGQLNTTAVEAFEKWKKTCEKTLWQLTTEYLARVRSLSMKVLVLDVNGEIFNYTHGSPIPNAVINSYQKGLYANGCWNVSPIKYDAITEDMSLIGPYSSTYGAHNTGNAITSPITITFWLQVIPLTLLTSAEKLKHNLS
jgi:hypothetical protein